MPRLFHHHLKPFWHQFNAQLTVELDWFSPLLTTAAIPDRHLKDFNKHSKQFNIIQLVPTLVEKIELWLVLEFPGKTKGKEKTRVLVRLKVEDFYDRQDYTGNKLTSFYSRA